MTTERPRTWRLMNKAQSYIVQTVMPEESTISLPVPARRDGRLVASFFVTIALPLRDGRNYAVYRPAVRIHMDWDEERVLGHELAREIVPIDQDQPVGLLNPPEFTGEQTDELEERIDEARSELYRLLDQVGPLYGAQDLSPAQRDLVAHCQRAYRRVVSADLWPSYEELNRDFFRWLESASAPPGCPNCGAATPPGGRFCSQCGHRLV